MSDTFTAAANSMFPNMAAAAAAAPTAPPAAQPAETDEQRQARSLYGDTSPKPAAVKPRDQNEPTDEIEAAERFYAGSPIHRDAGRALESAMLEQLATPEEAKSVVAEWSPLFEEFQLSSSESAQLTELGISAAVTLPSEETLAGWFEASRAGLRADFGPRAGEALAAARALVKSNPKLAQFLDETGLGNHPSYVRLAAARGLELRRRGKL